jgi:hypothetical protein
MIVSLCLSFFVSGGLLALVLTNINKYDDEEIIFHNN